MLRSHSKALRALDGKKIQKTRQDSATHELRSIEWPLEAWDRRLMAWALTVPIYWSLHVHPASLASLSAACF